jgi:hypothetical protein
MGENTQVNGIDKKLIQNSSDKTWIEQSTPEI